MNRTHRTVLLTAVALATSTFTSFAEKLIPAGSLIQCTVSENKLSSKTVAIGDPVLCQVGRSSNFPSGTVMSGTFEDYKDPGHLVGKGWMELVFDRMIFPSNDIVQVNSKVVAVPHYSVDTEGKILGRGHATRDTIEWLIPVLWPIDLINLPRRGPRPTLKNESRITIKVMDDIIVPDVAPTHYNQYGFAQRAEHAVYLAPAESTDAPSLSAVQHQRGTYPPPSATQQDDIVLVLKSGYNIYVTGYWDLGNGKFGYITNGRETGGRWSDFDAEASIAANNEKGIEFHVPGH